MSEKPLTMHPFESAIVRTLEADNTRLAAEIERLRAALEWQPIKTAPRDGTRFTAPNMYGAPTVGMWTNLYDGCWYDLQIGHLNGHWKPTHWRPLPPPPVTGDER